MTGNLPWIHVVGIGDDGLASLRPAVRALVDSAEVLVGGERHQAMVGDHPAERITWANGMAAALDQLAAHRGRRVVVLATGDPMCYGAGANLQRRFSAGEMVVLPVPGAFSLAAARMGWSLPDCETLTVHGRPLAGLVRGFAPGARLLVLSRDGDSAAAAAALLTEHGYGPSTLTVLEHLGGPAERRIDGIAEAWTEPRSADLNTLAIECRPGPDARLRPPVSGLPDDAFEHDGQITKREVRAATIAALAPLPGQVLWDVGAGSGAIAIEWLRAQPRRRRADNREAVAVAIERDPGRCAAIARNAIALGVPELRIVEGEAPAALDGLEPQPDTVFLGGDVAAPTLLEACWAALPSAGRLIANAVTAEGEARLIGFRQDNGGEMTRFAVSRLGPVGDFSAFRPLMPVTQYAGVKR